MEGEREMGQRKRKKEKENSFTIDQISSFAEADTQGTESLSLY